MASPELGLKRTCVSCGARFYDLTRSPAICPKCGTEQPIDQPRIRRPVEQTPVPSAANQPKSDDNDVDLGTDEDTDSDDDMEDASVLDDDDDSDLGADIEVNTDDNDNDN